MVTLTLSGEYNDPWLDCDGCDMSFQIIWTRNPVYNHVEYCPFCGGEVEEIIDEIEE